MTSMAAGIQARPIDFTDPELPMQVIADIVGIPEEGRSASAASRVKALVNSHGDE